MITKKEFDKFCKIMWQRIEMGQRKYGDKYLTTEIRKELEDELVDVANYAFMWNLKLKKKK